MVERLPKIVEPYLVVIINLHYPFDECIGVFIIIVIDETLWIKVAVYKSVSPIDGDAINQHRLHYLLSGISRMGDILIGNVEFVPLDELTLVFDGAAHIVEQPSARVNPFVLPRQSAEELIPKSRLRV